MISELHLTEWYRLCEDATPGPWVDRYSPVRERTQFFQRLCDFPERLKPLGECYLEDVDAEFIVAARTAMPMLLEEVRKLEAENLALKERLRVLEENCLFYPDEIVRRACGVSNV